jgi:S-adenosylhomocysteine hydrolase
MADQVIKVMWQGKEVEAEIVPIGEMKETVQTYILKDGSVLNVRLVVMQVARLKHEHNEQGDPVYVMKTQTAASAVVPENLKKKKS